MSQTLNGRVAIVTGASGGIGRAIVERFGADGARVVAADKVGVPDDASAVGGTETVWIQADLATSEGAGVVVQQAIDHFGAVDILVNNAGGGIIRPFLDHDDASMVETMARNLWTTVYCCRAALPHMLAAGRGRIINIGAESVRNGLFNHAMYNCAKGGVHGLTTGLAREYAERGVTVNVVAPAGIRTPTIAQRTGPEWAEMLGKTLALIPMRRLGEPEEIAAAVNFLATDDAAYITGQVISVNGGSSML